MSSSSSDDMELSDDVEPGIWTDIGSPKYDLHGGGLGRSGWKRMVPEMKK